MNDVEIIDFIEHHGTKGMRWGVRKGRSSGGGVGTERTRFGKAPKRLSDAELNARIKRMENEKKYNSLNKKDVGPGQRVASELLAKSGKKVVGAVITGSMVIALREALKKSGKLSEEHIKTLTKVDKK